MNNNNVLRHCHAIYWRIDFTGDFVRVDDSFSSPSNGWGNAGNFLAGFAIRRGAPGD